MLATLAEIHAALGLFRAGASSFHEALQIVLRARKNAVYPIQ